MSSFEQSLMVEARPSEEEEFLVEKLQSGEHSLDVRHQSVIDADENPIEIHRSKLSFV